MRTRLLALLGVMALLGAACGGDDTAEEAVEPTEITTEEPAQDDVINDEEPEDLGEVTVVMSTVTFQYLPALLGQDIGVWEERGLSVDTLDVQGSGAAAQAIAAGEGDVVPIAGISAGAPILAGLEARIVSTITNEFSSQVMVTSADSELESIEDLQGKTIGVVNRSGLLFWLANQLAESQGWTEGEDYEVAAVGGLSEQLAALEVGSTDAFIWTAEAAYQLEEDGEGRALFDFGEIVEENVNTVLVATNDLIDTRPEALEAFLAGWYETIAYMEANEAETVDACMRHFDMTEFVCQSIYESEMENFSTDGAIPEANLQSLAEAIAEVDEEITEAPASDAFFDGSFTPVEVG